MAGPLNEAELLSYNETFIRDLLDTIDALKAAQARVEELKEG